MPTKWRSFWSRHLAIKIFLPTLLATAFAVYAGSTLLQRRIAADLETELDLQSQGVVQTILYGVENLTRQDELERFLCVAGAGRQVKGIWLVCGNPGTVVASSHMDDIGLSVDRLGHHWPSLVVLPSSDEDIHLPNGTIVTSRPELSRELRRAGMESPSRLLVHIDHDPLHQSLRALGSNFRAYRLTVLLLLIISLVVVIHITVLRPLARLGAQVQSARHEAGALAIRDEGKDEIGLLAREVKQALLDLYTERSRFELIAERNPALIYRCRNDANWTMEYMSNAVLELTGRPPQDFIGNAAIDYESVIHPKDRDLVRIGVEEGLAGDCTWDIEYRVLHVDGSVRPVREQGRGHIDSRNGNWVLDGIILDLSARHRQEELGRQLEEAERVRQEGLRTMAGSVAHHVNNMLSGLIGGLELAKMEAEAGRPPVDDLRECLAMTERVAGLGRLMLLTTGEGGRERQTLLAGPLAQAHLSARRRDEHFCPLLEQEGEPTSGRFVGSAELIKQALDHLIDNAREASPGREDRIRLRAGLRVFTARELAQGQLPIVPHAQGNPFLEVVDEGEGMMPEILERAFDPFFTTRFTGRGLGLAAVSGIARLHRAGLVCRSALGEGTRITLVLPRSDEG